MKNFLLVLSVVSTLFISSTSFAYDRGDTVYTCHWNQDGFLWLGGRYHACKAIITEKIGSGNYRIEYLSNCQGYSSGESKITTGGGLFDRSSINRQPLYITG